MVAQKTKQANGIEGFHIAISSIGLIFFSYVLVKKSLEHSSILEISSIFIWIIFCIIQIYLQSNKLLNSKSENTLDTQDKYKVSPAVQQLIGIISAFIWGILLLGLYRGDIDFFKTQTQFVGKPEFEPFNHGSNLALGILFIVGALRERFDLKKSLLSSILFLFELMLVVSAMIAMMR
jgi:hypothetical protein